MQRKIHIYKLSHHHDHQGLLPSSYCIVAGPHFLYLSWGPTILSTALTVGACIIQLAIQKQEKHFVKVILATWLGGLCTWT